MKRARGCILILAMLGAATAQEPSARCVESLVASASAAEALAILDVRHRGRMMNVALAHDESMRLGAQAERVADLDGYLAKFSGARQAARVRMEIGQIALRNDAHRHVARRALKGFDVALVSPSVGILAAQLAQKLKFDDTRARLKVEVERGAKSIGARVRLADLLHKGMNERRWSHDLRMVTEKMATTNAQKAELMLNRAEVSRPKYGLDRSVYESELAKLSAAFPGTVSSNLARDKLAASKLRAGSDPIRFLAKGLGGEPVSLDDYHGKVLLVDFWATWSLACMKKIPGDVATYRKYHDRGFEVLGISLDHAKDRAHLTRVINESHMAWRHVHDGHGWLTDVARRYDVAAMPFNVLIGRDGKVVGTRFHGEQLDAMIQKALAVKK